MSVFFSQFFVVTNQFKPAVNVRLGLWVKKVLVAFVLINLSACKSEFDVFLTPFEQLSLPAFSLIVAVLCITTFAFLFRFQLNVVSKFFYAKRASQPVTNQAFLNRKSLSDSLIREMTKARKSHANFSAIQIRLDEFKNWNKDLGRKQSLRIEKDFCDCLIDSCRTLDICFKIGPCDYVILLPETQIQPAVALASKVLQETRKIKPDTNYLISASIGVTTFHNNDDVTSFLLRLKKACLKAVESGGNHFVAQLEA
jgi:diguanylate cyclase (GGDEF)-like protein